MGRTFKSRVAEFRSYWKYYVFQSLLATGSVYLVLLLLRPDETVIVASLGATAFVVFGIPEKITAQPRNVIGGHVVGLLSGLLGAWLLHQFSLADSHLENAVYAFVVGLSIFIMVISDTEHPPAAGTALALATQGFSMHRVAGVLVFAVLFTLIRLMLRHKLRDLT